MAKNKNTHKNKNPNPLATPAPDEPLGFNAWMKSERGIGRGERHDLRKPRKKRLRSGYDDYLAGFGGEADAGDDNPFTADPGALPGGGFNGGNAYEDSFFRENPQAGARAFLQSAGLSPGGRDAFGQWMEGEMQRMYEDFDAMRAESDNQNLSFLDYLANIGAVPYGSPNWADSFNRFMQQKYAYTPLEMKGLSYAPFEGGTRWLAFGT
jgi:hypothetical protein